MSIEQITTEELRKKQGKDGLILQGCGGDLREWQRGINKMLTEAGILLEGTNFDHIFTFEHDGVTCLLFPFEEEVKLSICQAGTGQLPDEYDGTAIYAWAYATGGRDIYRPHIKL